MNLAFRTELAAGYKGGPQRIRILSEDWVSGQAFCPNCGHLEITRYKNNEPVADFFCSVCDEDYELKGHGRPFGPTIVDGAYRTMMKRLRAANNPNLMLLGYDPKKLEVLNLLVVPKHFFVPEIIEQRKPLAAGARRAGWVGCKIRLDAIPDAGRIYLVREGKIVPSASVTGQWRQTLFLREPSRSITKGWLLAVMRCIDRINREEFSLSEVYGFEAQLMQTYPGNRNIRPKMRQQLQVLRDMGYLRFTGKGVYKLAFYPGSKRSNRPNTE